MRGGKKAKKARLENHDIDAPTGPFPFFTTRGGKSRRFGWDLFRGLMALALRDSKAEEISMSLCKDELPWRQIADLSWEETPGGSVCFDY